MTPEIFADSVLRVMRIACGTAMLGVLYINARAMARSFTRRARPLDPMWALFFWFSFSMLWLLSYPVLVSPRHYTGAIVSAYMAVGYALLLCASIGMIGSRIWYRDGGGHCV